MQRLHLPLILLCAVLCHGQIPTVREPVHDWPKAPTIIENYVTLAIERNTALRMRALDVDGARAGLAQVRGALQPQVELVARYTVATGGRTIEFPVGDLLNPVYRTLNDFLAAQGKPAPFPQISNQSINFYRDHEQETKLRVLQPLYRPEITRAVAAGRAAVASREASLAAYRRELRLTVVTAYHRWLQAEAAASILEAAGRLTAEALRVNRLLFENDKVTEDRVLRSQADALEVKQQQFEIARDRNLARAHFNFLLNQPLETALESVSADALQAAEAALIAAVPVATRSPAQREELAALEHGVTAARAAEEAVRARLRPTLGLAIETGLQGESYRSGGNANFFQGSLVGELNLWDGARNRSRLALAAIERRRIELQRDDVRAGLALQVQQAADEFRAAAAAGAAAQERETATRRAFALVSAREREGLANQLTFLDARNEFTRAELNRQIIRQRLFIAAAAYERAAALTPPP